MAAVYRWLSIHVRDLRVVRIIARSFCYNIRRSIQYMQYRVIMIQWKHNVISWFHIYPHAVAITYSWALFSETEVLVFWTTAKPYVLTVCLEKKDDNQEWPDFRTSLPSSNVSFTGPSMYFLFLAVSRYLTNHSKPSVRPSPLIALHPTTSVRKTGRETL